MIQLGPRAVFCCPISYPITILMKNINSTLPITHYEIFYHICIVRENATTSFNKFFMKTQLFVIITCLSIILDHLIWKNDCLKVQLNFRNFIQKMTFLRIISVNFLALDRLFQVNISMFFIKYTYKKRFFMVVSKEDNLSSLELIFTFFHIHSNYL